MFLLIILIMVLGKTKPAGIIEILIYHMVQDLAKFLGPMAYFNLNGDNMATYKEDESGCPFVYSITAIEKVVDGDTVDAVIDLGFDVRFDVGYLLRFDGRYRGFLCGDGEGYEGAVAFCF